MSSSNCPVCRCVFVKPRIYPSCGHSVCSHCMKECDRYTDRPFIHSAILYKCPVCREQTLIPWYKRTRNMALESVCEDLPEYAERLAELGPLVPPEEGLYDDDVDLAKVSTMNQESIVLQLYEEVMPALVAAANEGRSFITLDDQRVVKRLHPVADCFSNFLFDRHNVYRVMLTSTDATFHFSRRNIRIRNDFVNTNWQSPLDDETLSHTSDVSVSLPQSSIFTRISNIMDLNLSASSSVSSGSTLIAPVPPPLPPPSRSLENRA
jgi:hypothetical protein